MSELRSVCVYCGSRVGSDPLFRASAERLGRLLAERGIRLVYGAGGIGLMGVVARAVLAAGGSVTGVIPRHLVRREVALDDLDDMIVVETMHERKTRMFELSQAFITLPGGIGTLDETIEMLTWRMLTLHDKPVVMVNVGGYWDSFLAMFDHVIAQGFADPDLRRHLTVVSSVEEALAALEAALPA